jgi:N,N'-diacetyllegionaminate synthase
MNRTTIIAEAGVNHNGNFEMAKKLIDVAKEAGADYVKFQTFKADHIVSKHARKADYQLKNFGEGDDTQYSMLKKLELPYEWHHLLKAYAEKSGIKFLSTAFDHESVDFLDALGIDFFKIPSGEITNKPYLQHIARKGRPVVLSTGMANMEEIRDAIHVLNAGGKLNGKLTILHCNTEYPTPFSDVNLRAILSIAKEFSVPVGYSDHTLGTEVAVAAVAMGAVVIEKHFTLDRTLIGPDHKASLEPTELKSMVDQIRNIEEALGHGKKEPTESERRNILAVRKSLHYKKDLTAGASVTDQDLLIVRPSNGISPMKIEQVIGRKLKNSVTTGQAVSAQDFI